MGRLEVLLRRRELPGGSGGCGDGLASDKGKPESEGLLEKPVREGSSPLSRESPISNPLPEELTKKDFKGNSPSPNSGGGGGRKLTQEQAAALIIRVPKPPRRLQSSFATGLSQPSYGLSLRTQGGEIPLLLEELQAKLSKHLSLLDLPYRAELDSGVGGNVAPNLIL